MKPKEKGAEAPLYIGGQEEYLALIQTAQGYYVLPIDWAALNWRTPKESNLQPSVLETDALPIELEILYLVDALGIEPSEP